MDIETMRWIDRRVGVPLCALATLLMRFRDRLRRRQVRPIRRILFVELSELGATVLAQPAMRKARERTGAELYFVIFAKNRGSLALVGDVPSANIFGIRDTSLFHLAIDSAAFLVWARRRAIDTVIDLELFSRFTALLTGLCGADRRVGFHRFHNEGLYRGEMLTHRVGYNPHIHIAKNLLALVEALTAAAPEVPYSKATIGDDELVISIPHASAAERAAMLRRICAEIHFDPQRQRLILINPNASELLPHRRWMQSRYAELIRRLVSDWDDVVVAITGSPDESREAEALAASAGSRCVSLAGKTALTELSSLYANAALMVSNDSGPAHFAAASGLPTIVLFGPETPKLYRPLGNSRAIYAGLACSPCVSAYNHRKTACTDNVCMQAITVDQVYAAAAEILNADRRVTVLRQAQ